MFPDNPYAESQGSFQTPVFPPNTDPGDSPTQTLSISCEWLPYIRGALQQLLLQSTWKYTSQAQLDLAQARAATLISMFSECSSGGVPFACEWDFRGLTGLPFTRVTGYAAAGWSADTIGVHGMGGWSDTQITNSGSGDHLVGCDIEHSFSVTKLSAVVMHLNFIKGTFDNPSGVCLWVDVQHSGSTVCSTTLDFASASDGVQDFTCAFGLTDCDYIRVVAYSTRANSPINLGSVDIESITVFGEGVPIC